MASVVVVRRSEQDPSSLDFQGGSIRNFPAQLDELGRKSAVAQNLKHAITTHEKMLSSDGEQTLLAYVRLSDSQVLGFAKFGFKSLFFYKPPKGNVIQADRCLCLLDFYVLEDFQRSGIGKALFEQFLKASGSAAEEVAYDRPSPKLLSFLAKHYKLLQPDHQPNRYTVYPSFFKHM